MQWQSRQHTRAARCARGPFPSSVDRPETQTRRKSSRSGGWKRKIESPTAGHSLSRKINIYRAKVAAKNIAVINVVRGLWVQPLSSLPGPSLCLMLSAISSEPRRFASPGQSHSHTLCCDKSLAAVSQGALAAPMLDTPKVGAPHFQLVPTSVHDYRIQPFAY